MTSQSVIDLLYALKSVYPAKDLPPVFSVSDPGFFDLSVWVPSPPRVGFSCEVAHTRLMVRFDRAALDENLTTLLPRAIRRFAAEHRKLDETSKR